jgi:uncharacterized SAM-binding protein YcdF (DUF218 family)
VVVTRRLRWWRVVLVVLLVFCLWIAGIALEIGREAGGDPLRKADAIVVFGAAEYAGRPSPIFRSRLDHALELWKQGYAPVIITTGGYAEDPKFSEGGVGGRYLQTHGVPEQKIVAETQAGDTSQSAQRVSAIMHVNGMHDCIAVSDGYHLFRIKRMMRRHGIAAYGAPRRELHTLSARQRIALKLREAFSYTAWLLHLT